MDTEKQKYLRDLNAAARHVSERIEGLCRPLDTTALGWKPGPQSWSVAEVLGHLTRTADLYFPRIRQTMVRSRERSGGEDAPFRPWWLARLFLLIVSPDSKRRLSAPAKFRPVDREARPEVVDQFLERQQALEELIAETETCNLNHPRFGSPITALIRFSVGEALTILVRHAERHTLQIERVLAARTAAKAEE